jgi:hypothetical protein
MNEQSSVGKRRRLHAATARTPPRRRGAHIARWRDWRRPRTFSPPHGPPSTYRLHKQPHCPQERPTGAAVPYADPRAQGRKHDYGWTRTLPLIQRVARDLPIPYPNHTGMDLGNGLGYPLTGMISRHTRGIDFYCRTYSLLGCTQQPSSLKIQTQSRTMTKLDRFQHIIIPKRKTLVVLSNF